MSGSRFARVIPVICVLSLMSAQGCATDPEPSVPSTEDLRAYLGTVGILAAGRPPAIEGLGPIGWREEWRETSGEGASYGAYGGMWGGLALGLICGPFFFVCSPVFAVGGLAVGGLTGAVTEAVIESANALPTSTRTDLELALRKAISDSDVRTELTGHVQSQFPVNSEQKVINLGIADPSTADVSPDYRPFVASGVDTVLEIGINQLALARGEDGDATFALLINTYAHLIDVSNNEVLWSNPQIVYLSSEAELSLWTASDSHYLRTEIDSGLERLAEQTHNQIFGAS